MHFISCCAVQGSILKNINDRLHCQSQRLLRCYTVLCFVVTIIVFFRLCLVCLKLSKDVFTFPWFCIFSLRICLLSFHSRHLSQLPVNQNEVPWMFSIKKKFKFSFEPFALNLNCCEIHILRYNFKSCGCFTSWNSHPEFPVCSY